LVHAVKTYGLNKFFDTAICPILNGTDAVMITAEAAK